MRQRKGDPKLSYDYYANVTESIVLTLVNNPIALALYVRVCAFAEMQKEMLFTNKQLAEEYGTSERHIKRGWAKLVEVGLVVKHKSGRNTIHKRAVRGGILTPRGGENRGPSMSPIAKMGDIEGPQTNAIGDTQSHLSNSNRGHSEVAIGDIQCHSALYIREKDLKKEEEREKGSITVGECTEEALSSFSNSNSGLEKDTEIELSQTAAEPEICPTTPNNNQTPTTARTQPIQAHTANPREREEVVRKRRWLEVMKILAGGDEKKIRKGVCAEWYRWFGHLDHELAVSVAQIVVLQTTEKWLPTRQEFYRALEAVQNPNPNLWSEEYEAFCEIEKLGRSARRTPEGWRRMNWEEMLVLLQKACPNAAQWLRWADVKEYRATSDENRGFYRAQWKKRWEEGRSRVREAQIVERAVGRKVAVLG